MPPRKVTMCKTIEIPQPNGQIERKQICIDVPAVAAKNMPIESGWRRSLVRQ